MTPKEEAIDFAKYVLDSNCISYEEDVIERLYIKYQRKYEEEVERLCKEYDKQLMTNIAAD